MPFHRLSVPSYFGGLPGGYDYINNAISGTPSNADGAKVGGTNAGTYFVAFGEDGTSANANRANKALAQNTDFIDDLLHADLAIPTRTANVTPGAPVSSITITGPGIFLGGIGDELQDLFHITDDNDDDIEVTGTKVAVASISAGGTLGSGFSAGNVTVLLTVAIPTGTTYRVWYGTRSNLATLPSDAFTTIRIRSAVQVDATTEELFRLLHGNGEAWNAAWDSDIYTLNQSILELRTLLANLHGNSEAYNAAWDDTVYGLAKARATAPVLRWDAGVATTAPVRFGVYIPKDSMWFTFGGLASDQSSQSRDYGRTWEAIPFIGTYAATYSAVATDGSATLVMAIADGSGSSVVGVRSAYNHWSFTQHASAFAGIFGAGGIQWDSTHAKFVAAYWTTTALKVQSSPDGVTWTSATTVPTAWSTATTGAPVVGVTPGRVVAAFLDTIGAVLNIMFSTDGGANWTAATSNGTPTITSNSHLSHIVYDAVSAAWYMIVWDDVALSSQLLVSTDGGANWTLRWTKVMTIYDLAVLPGGVLVMVVGNYQYTQQIVLSVDGGVTNYFVGSNAQTNTAQLFMLAGGGGAMILNDSDQKAWTSSRYGFDTSDWGTI